MHSTKAKKNTDFQKQNQTKQIVFNNNAQSSSSIGVMYLALVMKASFGIKYLLLFIVSNKKWTDNLLKTYQF